MIIKADKEGMESLKELLDVALKVGGLNNLKGVTDILNTIEEIEEVEEIKEE